MPEVLPEPPLVPSTDALVQRAIEQLKGQYPNWKPNPASAEYRTFKAFAAICCEVIILALNVPEAIIRFMGEVVYQTPPTPATYATATSTWEATDEEGYEIEAGTIVLVTPTGGEPVALEVTEGVVIAAATTTTAAGAVHLRAVESGKQANIPESRKVDELSEADVARVQALAESYGAAIVSADSRQIYRHFDIGTAKTPTRTNAPSSITKST